MNISKKEELKYRKRAFKYLPPYCDKCFGHLHLEVHHKDGNRKNNVLSNLQILCGNCHRKEHGIKLKIKYPKKYHKGTKRVHKKWK